MVAKPLIRYAETEPEDFDQFVLLPKNRDKLFEFIAGEIVEVVSNPQSSNIGLIIGSFVNVFVMQKNLGHVTGADGGYNVGRERYMPDVAYISYQRQRILQSVDGYNPLPPNLAVEVISPSNTDADMDVKIANYLAAGTVVWRVKPIEKQIAVFVPGKPVLILGIKDVLDGGEVLPGFTLMLKDIFREPPA